VARSGSGLRHGALLAAGECALASPAASQPRAGIGAASRAACSPVIVELVAPLVRSSVARAA
jgi:hypothetical protein